jgi:hypothetical protein
MYLQGARRHSGANPAYGDKTGLHFMGLMRLPPGMRALVDQLPWRRDNMNFWTKPLLTATLVSVAAHCVVFSGVAMARDDEHAGEARAEITRNMDERLERLESALALTPDQKPAWEEFKRAVKERSERMAARRGEARRAGGTGDGEHRAPRGEMAGQGDGPNEMRKNIESFTATLSSEQKAVFDAEFGKFSPRDGQRRAGREQRPGNEE